MQPPPTPPADDDADLPAVNTANTPNPPPAAPPKIIRIVEIEYPGEQEPPLYQVIELSDEIEICCEPDPATARQAAWRHALEQSASLLIDKEVVWALEAQHLEHVRDIERSMQSFP